MVTLNIWLIGNKIWDTDTCEIFYLRQNIYQPFSHLTSPSVTDSANAGVLTVMTSSPVKKKPNKKKKGKRSVAVS